tara:strand:- start:1021 stop:1278 length:258 start_codon:yes stop_codon:yes gene_type:complete
MPKEPKPARVGKKADDLADAVEASKEYASVDHENMILCDCTDAVDDMPYNTGGCLRCPALDASFYIQNFIGELVQHYNMDCASLE